MRTVTRTAASIVVALTLSVVLAIPASAAQIISYRGETSAPRWNRMAFQVLKKDNGRRFVHRIGLRFTLTCEDATTEDWVLGIFFFGGAPRLGDGGEFSIEDDFGSEYFAVDGVIGFRHASGTVVDTQARLTEDHLDSQVCTTGDLTWTAERTDARPARLSGADVPEGAGFEKVRVTDGVAEVVKLIEP
jgi:hypothetical protein